ncbi:cyclase family protein [Sediminitomix flava]|uniref:Kynurenine formamidase n=1 Tax=Sediminitomix flava TaxID=379075 RepID=A0A315Z6L5_SEDFL|nr:cyclase family protein [Sediminitomix flava]PWJ39294.1 kynurenine formamidase [Sediminitomix flava]
MNKSLLYLLVILCFSCKHSSPSSSNNNFSLEDLKIVDLSYDFSDSTVYWVTAKEFELEEVSKGHTEKGYYYSANNYAAAEHGGTHIDAPIHFAENRQSVDEIPLEKLIGSALKVDVSEKAKDNPDYEVSIEDFLEWEEKHKNMPIPEGSIVLLYTGFSKYYPDKMQYMGTCERGAHAVKDLHFPGLAPDAAEWLVKNRKINAVGIDTPSIDYGQSEYFQSHVNLMTNNVPAFENLANLEQLPSVGFEVVALPMKIKGGTGAPLRIIALLK